MKGTQTTHEYLTTEMVNVINVLRSCRYGIPLPPEEGSASGRVQGFVDDLVNHMREEEDTLFPVIVALCPDLEPEVEAAAEEHWTIHTSARELQVRVDGGNLVGAHETARALMSRILEHMQHESDLMARAMRSSEGGEETDVDNVIFEWRVKAAVGELTPLLEEWDATIEILSAWAGHVVARLTSRKGADLLKSPVRSQITRRLRKRVPEIGTIEIQ